jgi:4-hydroxy-tetrahydrodipicolinate synthase
VGDYPHSRPPQGILPEAAKVQIRTTFENAGLAKQLVGASPARSVEVWE